jgi:Flp pilus assembly protein TadD
MIQNDFKFGNTMAQKGLWNEALYRWEKQLSQGKETAALYNNIAIALENLGKPDEARVAYQKALELRPDHPIIKKNYTKFKGNQEKEK